jgi:hypothetical protein
MNDYTRALLLSVIGVLVLFTAVPAHADSASNQYQIQINSLEFSPPTNESKDNTFTVGAIYGKSAVTQLQNNGYYLVKGTESYDSAYNYLYIARTNISLGVVTPNTPVTVNSDLQTQSKGTNGYILTAQQQDTMKSLSGEQIPNTKCDTLCTPNSSDTWKDAVGFGYSLSDNAYRPFATKGVDTLPGILVSKEEADTSKLNLQYKLITSPLQTETSYQTTINYLLLPYY